MIKLYLREMKLQIFTMITYGQ